MRAGVPPVGARSSTVPNTGKRLPSRIGGKYRPIRVLGHGGMSVVYEVEHAFTKERLALKVLNGNSVTLDSVSLARFRREARMSALMRSEHVVRVVDADIAPELNGAPFLVMDLLEGADLATLARHSPQSSEQVVTWFRHVARALDLAHRYGVVHRDLKPENLFLTRSRTGEPLVKVLDFGVASIPLLDEATGTKTGAFVGTPRFMSPEQASGADVGAAADVWSVAMSVFRLLSGEDYWEAPNVTLLLARIVYEDVVPPSSRGFYRGVGFDEWFLKSCARDPAKRWGSIGEQVEALAAALDCPVLEIPALPDEGPLLRHYESGDFDVSDRYEDRAHSLGGSVTSGRAEALPRWRTLAAVLAFAAATITVALQFGHRSSGAPPERLQARMQELASRRGDTTPLAVPVPVPESSAVPGAGVMNADSPGVVEAPSAAIERTRTTRPLARASSTKKAVAPMPSAKTAAPAAALPAGSSEPRRADPLADPD